MKNEKNGILKNFPQKEQRTQRKVVKNYLSCFLSSLWWMKSFLTASFILFVAAGCLPTADGVKQKMERLQQADTEHQKKLSQELDTDFDKPLTTPVTRKKSSVTLEEGEASPSWVRKLPEECEVSFYCGLAFIDFCKNANSCREEAETKARDDLRKRIAVRIQSQTSSRIYSERGLGQNESAHKTFQSEIRERAVSIELKDVKFSHFYLRPIEQLQTLARMERPKKAEAEPVKKQKIPANAVSRKLPPLLLAFTDDEKTPDLNQPAMQTLYQQRLTEALRQENVVFTENGAFQNWGALRGVALRQHAAEVLAEHPENAVVVLSFSGRLDPHQGRLFKGLATVFLNVAAYGKEGTPLFRKSFTARRFIPKPPDKLTDVQRQEQFLRTVEKGLNEFEDELITELKKALYQVGRFRSEP